MASISISQGAVSRIGSRVRPVRQNDETDADATDDENPTVNNNAEDDAVPTRDRPEPDNRDDLRVVVSPDVIQVQRGQTVELTCTVYGGDLSTNIYWIQDEPERRHALIEPATEHDREIAPSQVTLRSRITLDDPDKIGKYTCMAQNSAGNSGSAVLTMREGGGYLPQPTYLGTGQPAPNGGRGYLRIIVPDMSEGDMVELQCEGASAEDESRIQWYFNNQHIRDEQPFYSQGRTLHIRPISQSYLGNYRCTIPTSGYTDGTSVLTFAGSHPAPVAPVQPAASRCGSDEATCGNGQCIPRAYICDGKNDCADNSDESCSHADVCQPNEIRCSSTVRGRKCVQKFWMCDGDRDCEDGSDEEQRYCELLPRQRYCKTNEFQCVGTNGANGKLVCIPRAFQCDSHNDCPDQSDEIGCAKPTIISPPERQIQINLDETLTIRCTVRGSPAPYINWRLNWGHICPDCPENDRCTMAQSVDPNDPTLITGTLTIRRINANDAGAYSCEALNNQGFTFAVPDAIVNVIIGSGQSRIPSCIKPVPRPTTVPVPTAAPAPDPPAIVRRPCYCNGHSNYCLPNGQCQNCQHNTIGFHCEYCATGYQGDALRGTDCDCELILTYSRYNCNLSGTRTERDGYCFCKYNVEGDRCTHCRRGHFYLNSISTHGCLPCFCSGISTDCTSTDWRRQAIALPLTNWNAVSKNFNTNQYQAGDKIQKRDGGRELALDQNSLGRPAQEVLYWKAPTEVLGDFATLYDGNIDIHFTNDGNGNRRSNEDEFISLRGNNIELIHQLPSPERFRADTKNTYSVACNERTFARKDAAYTRREDILMVLSNLDTLLIKINPMGGRRNAVLHGVTFNVATRDGYADSAPSVESCRCPANYTGASCQKCAEGYGRVHPVGDLYLGQCYSCRTLCHERSGQCDRETGKCSNCESNSEGDHCERCHAGYVLDGRTNRCVQNGRNQPDQVHKKSIRGTYKINQELYDAQSSNPMTIVLNGNQLEQRISLEILDAQPISVVWTRADGSSLPTNVIQQDNDLLFRKPAAEQAGKYICTITYSDGNTERLAIHLNYRPGSVQPDNRVLPVRGNQLKLLVQPKSIVLKEGQRLTVQYQVGSQDPVEVVWNKITDQGSKAMPSLFDVEPNRLTLRRATLETAGTYEVTARNAQGEAKEQLHIKVEPRRRRRVQATPQIHFQQDQYDIAFGDTIDVVPKISGADGATITWSKDGSSYLPTGVTARTDGVLYIEGRSSDIGGKYNLNVTNAHGGVSSSIHVQWRETSNTQSNHGSGNQNSSPSPVDVRFQADDEQSRQVGQNIRLQCAVNGDVARPYEYAFTKDGRPLENNVEVHPDGLLIVRNAQENDAGHYRCEVTFPSAPEVEAQERSYDLRIESTSVGDRNHQNDADQSQQHKESIMVIAEPTEVTIGRGETASIQCRVQGAQEYKVTWSGYGHDTTLPDYARQEGDSVTLTPTANSPAEQIYLQCQVNVSGQTESHHAYVPVTIRGEDESNRKRRL